MHIVMVVGALLGAPAFAEPAPTIASAPAWVETVAIPEPNPKLAEMPLQSLRVAMQSLYTADGGAEYYVEMANAVQNPQGLSALGNVSIAWQPAQGDLIIHKVQIVRAGRVIDLLAGGPGFTTLRRENNLESAVLDGVLTAVMQPEGLSVGDVIDVAYTIRAKAGAIPFRGENLLTLSHGTPSRFVRFREIWEDGVPMRWRATEAMGKPRLKKGRWGTELVLDLRDAEGPEPPDDAPQRFRIPATLEISQYRDWNEIGRMLAPAYASAAAIAAESPLKAEIERIAAASSDPRTRAMAALRLVQDRIRYLALNMGEGGYLPASADQTWSRKFGDCKGKTVTLLALLSGLGIEAEPVLVSSAWGDSLFERLPLVRVFDHVLVRARIDGRSYWLDGTRMGDRRIEDLTSLSFGWGLPVTAAGAPLERLPFEAPELPLSQTILTYDASAGFHLPVPVSAEIVFRGEQAATMRAAVSLMGKDGIRDPIRRRFDMAGEQGLTSFDIKEDDAAGTVTILFSGKAAMRWPKAPGSNAFRFRFDDDAIRWSEDFERESGPLKSAPFELPFPAYETQTETIILPKKGEGFSIEGRDFDRTVGGTRIRRTLTLADGRAVAESSLRRLRKELTAAEALAAKPALAEINADRAYVRAPAGYDASAEERAAIIATTPTNATGFVERGYRLMGDGKLKEALADFDSAIALSPQHARAHANRGIALLHSRDYDGAKAALDKAAALAGDREDFVVPQGYGLLHLAQERPAEAVEALSRSLALEPDNAFTLAARAEAYQQSGRFAEALTDLDRAIPLRTEPADLIVLKARLASFSGDEPRALAAAEQLIGTADSRLAGSTLKAEILARFGKPAEAAEAYAAALAELDRRLADVGNADSKRRVARQRVSLLIDSGRVQEALQLASDGLRAHPGGVEELNSRCWSRALANVELEPALKDCDLALRSDPDNPHVIDSRGYVKLRLGRLDDAIADFDAALRLAPTQSASLYGRGLARLRKGDREGGERDLAAARRLTFDVESRFKRYGLMP